VITQFVGGTPAEFPAAHRDQTGDICREHEVGRAARSLASHAATRSETFHGAHLPLSEFLSAMEVRRERAGVHGSRTALRIWQGVLRI
jgi:hypothetical protein